MVLGRDGTATTLARFQGRLHSATLTRPAESAIDLADPTAAPTGTPTTDECEGYAFDYEQRDIDGTRVMKGDYAVTLLRGTLSFIPLPGDQVTIAPPGSTTQTTSTVIAIEAITEAFVTVQVRGGAVSTDGFDGVLESP
jgi:hypothetical protein